MVSFDILLIIVALGLQPLFAMLWVVLGFRYLMRKAGEGTSEWVDSRVEKVGEELKP